MPKTQLIKEEKYIFMFCYIIWMEGTNVLIICSKPKHGSGWNAISRVEESISIKK